MAYLPKGIGDPILERSLFVLLLMAGMAYLPKGIGDKPLTSVSKTLCAAGMAYLPKGIGDNDQPKLLQV